MRSIEKIYTAFAEIRQALDRVTVGYHEFKDALVVALVKQCLGVRGGHVLVFGPTGTAKTRTTKGLARILGSVGIPVPYERVQGNPDTMPSDFLFRRTADYGEDGRLRFVWNLQKIGSFERKPGQAVPGLFQFDELDKVTANGQFALLEAMEEQQVTVLDGRTVPLNFMLVATANTRKFDPTAKPLSRAVQDRFGAVVLLGYQGLEDDLEMLEQTTSSLREPEIRLNHFPVQELEELRRQVQESGLPLRVSDDMKRRIVTVVKLTQQRIAGYTDFVRYIKVPAGPRGILDLYWESSITALLTGSSELTAEYPLQVGLRVLRGRVEVTPEAEIDGMTTDVVITKILAEVFGDNITSFSSRPFEQTSSGISSAPGEEKGKKAEQEGEESRGEEEAKDSDGESKPDESKAESEPQPSQQTAPQPKAGQDKPPKDSFQMTSQPRQQPQASQPDWKKESFLANLRKEAQKSSSGQPQEDQGPKVQGKDSSPKGTDQVSPGQTQSQEDIHGGENASGEVPDSPNGAQDGQQQGQSGQPSSSGQPGQEGKSDSSSSQAVSESASSGDSTDSSSGSQRQGRQTTSEGSEGESEGEDGDGQGKTIKTIASRQALAQWLAQQAAAEQFRTREGLKTGAEIAQELASGKQKFDFESQDGKFKAAVRGQRAICQGNPEDVQKIVRQEQASQKFGQATIGGQAAGKGPGYPVLDTFTFPPHITSILPMLRGMSGEKVVEKLADWINLPPNQKARTGVEYRLIKGFVHLAALQAVRNSEEVESSELTASPSGERMDFVIGRRDDLPLDEERTVMEALSQGGVVDDLSEVHEKRVRADAPQILFVLDGSGSMGYENRMMSAAVAAAATAQKYGPLGATQGLIVFTSNPALVVPMPETEVERIVDGIFSVSPSGGTSYATALELAFRHAPPKTTVVVLGDFKDSGQLSQEALAIKSSKEMKVVGIVSSAGNPEYAGEICDETYLVGFEDPTSVALITIKASIT
jgi:MoxR-like ATPase